MDDIHRAGKWYPTRCVIFAELENSISRGAEPRGRYYYPGRRISRTEGDTLFQGGEYRHPLMTKYTMILQYEVRINGLLRPTAAHAQLGT